MKFYLFINFKVLYQVSKLGKLKCKTDTESIQDVKADDLRQMFLAMTDEVPILYDCVSVGVVVLFISKPNCFVPGPRYYCQAC